MADTFNAAEGCTHPLDTEDVRLLALHGDAVQKFKEWCQSIDPDDPAFEEIDFDGVALGFFIANGVTGDSSGEGETHYDAFMLCTLVRYNYHYWMP